MNEKPTQSMYQAFERARQKTARCDGNFLGTKSFEETIDAMLIACGTLFTREEAEKHVMEKVKEFKIHKDDRLFFYLEYPKDYDLDSTENLNGLSINVHKIWESDLNKLRETHELFKDTTDDGPITPRLQLK